MIEREVVLGNSRYPYHFDFDCIDEIVDTLETYQPDRFLVVTDDTVLNLHGDALLPVLGQKAPVVLLTHPSGEEMKSPQALGDHLEAALRAGASRKSLVVSFGGGVPGNLAGMVAAVLFRGVGLVHIPTTTMAATDSVISLKQAINSGIGKHHIGAYHRPEAVYADLSLLQTLSEREVRSGLCEVVKNCLTIRPQSIPRLREMLEEDPQSTEVLLWLLEESLVAKMTVLIDDEKERQAGLVLEYGHTTGHAIEFCDQHVRGVEAISHGEAVALGMIVAARVAAELGCLSEQDVAMHEELITALGVEPQLPTGVDPDAVLKLMLSDNKRGFMRVDKGQVPMVLLNGLGKPRQSPGGMPLVPVPFNLVRAEVARLQPAQAPEPVEMAGVGLRKGVRYAG
jgi:3-dehydroquinate synthase/2-deoxy-scyllo-inosose synthase